MADWTEDISELQLEIPLLRKSHMSHAAKSWGAQAHKPPFFGGLENTPPESMICRFCAAALSNNNKGLVAGLAGQRGGDTWDDSWLMCAANSHAHLAAHQTLSEEKPLTFLKYPIEALI